MASASGAEVRGPVATMTLRQSAGGRPAISAALDLDQGMVVQRLGDGGGKSVAVDRQRAAGRHLIGVGGAHDQRAQPAHFGMQQPDRIVGGIIGAERIGADQFGKAVGAMGFGHPDAGASRAARPRMPDLATCQAASEPARPAPTICTVSEEDLVPVMAQR